MSIELRDILTALAILGTFISIYFVNRNAKRSWTLQQRQAQAQAENTDLTRIRDLRVELNETKGELATLRGQVTEMQALLDQANQRGMLYAETVNEMFRYARMGVTMEQWLKRFDNENGTPSLRARQ